MANVFRRKGILKALFGVDQPGTTFSSRRKKARLQRHDPQDCLSTMASDKGEQKLTLLTLPLEIRLRVYDLCLISSFDPNQNPPWAVGNAFGIDKRPEYRTVEPAILRACKQIYEEAAPILYSKNVFDICEPKTAFDFIAVVSPTKFKLIMTMELSVSSSADISEWLALLKVISMEATGLRYLEVGWGANYATSSSWPRDRGLGDNVPFVRALAKFRQLDKLKIRGWYARNWPSYLKKELGAHVQVHAIETLIEVDEEKLNNRWSLEIYEGSVRGFKEYQRGTEDLFP